MSKLIGKIDNFPINLFFYRINKEEIQKLNIFYFKDNKANSTLNQAPKIYHKEITRNINFNSLKDDKITY